MFARTEECCWNGQYCAALVCDGNRYIRFHHKINVQNRRTADRYRVRRDHAMWLVRIALALVACTTITWLLWWTAAALFTNASCNCLILTEKLCDRLMVIADLTIKALQLLRDSTESCGVPCLASCAELIAQVLKLSLSTCQASEKARKLCCIVCAHLREQDVAAAIIVHQEADDLVNAALVLRAIALTEGSIARVLWRTDRIGTDFSRIAQMATAATTWALLRKSIACGADADSEQQSTQNKVTK